MWRDRAGVHRGQRRAGCALGAKSAQPSLFFGAFACSKARPSVPLAAQSCSHPRLTRRTALYPVPQPLQQGFHGAAAHPGVAADLQGHQPWQALEGFEAEEGQAPIAEVQISELHQALEGLGVHPAQPRVVAQVDVHEAVGFLEHVGGHVAEVVVAQVQVCQALGVEEEARGQLHQGVVTQIQHPELHVAREVAGRHGCDAVVGQAEVASVHWQVWGHGEQPLAAAIHHLVMARTEDRAASAGI